MIRKVSFINYNIIVLYFCYRKTIFLATCWTSIIFKQKTKWLFTSWKLGSIRESKSRFRSCIVTFDWYFSQLFVTLKPDFNCVIAFYYLELKKLQLEHNFFVSVNAKTRTWLSTEPSLLKQWEDQVKIRLISQSVNSISGVF